jgi:diadenosine tetraphosphatase ApaH/serine/threonine PP2A family protein phosphatase
MLRSPARTFALRGNHEFSHVNRVYGFFEEVAVRYSATLWSEFQAVFAQLPLAAVVASSVFCVHGGLSPELAELEDIASVPLPLHDYFDSYLVSDLVWSDPSDSVADFADNPRGSGVVFGTAAVRQFLADNGLKLLVRAHQCVVGGFEMFADNCGLTLFSSSDYCREEPNRCGVACVWPKGRVELFSIAADHCTRDVMVLGPKMGLKRPIFADDRRKNQTMQPSLMAQYAPRKMAIATPKKATPRNAKHSTARLAALVRQVECQI